MRLVIAHILAWTLGLGMLALLLWGVGTVAIEAWSRAHDTIIAVLVELGVFAMLAIIIRTWVWAVDTINEAEANR